MSEWTPMALSDVVVEAKPGFACGEEMSRTACSSFG